MLLDEIGIGDHFARYQSRSKAPGLYGGGLVYADGVGV